MPHLVAALFKDAGQADKALQAVLELGILPSRIAIAGRREGREISSISGFRTLSIEEDIAEELRRLSLPPEELHAFASSIRKGHTLVAVQVSDAEYKEVIRVLQMFAPVDLEEAGGKSASGSAPEGTAPLAAGVTGGVGEGLTNTASLPGMGELAGGDDLGTADLRTSNPRGGSTLPTGRSAEARETRPGIGALRRDLSQSGPVRSYRSS
ncbi:hypothetical protein [Microvirga puerhi]|uniref:Uncharacterized protein n=1 Tax=Microvirga puerhi TaxID=2876078 RepID=A0ABS7VSC3_9HYPH|nr:hypothetical protein [Microvirga puerhi]MBZ6077813.1 hypothetical protein [Microvirga puerhi]